MFVQRLAKETANSEGEQCTDVDMLMVLPPTPGTYEPVKLQSERPDLTRLLR